MRAAELEAKKLAEKEAEEKKRMEASKAAAAAERARAEAEADELIRSRTAIAAAEKAKKEAEAEAMIRARAEAAALAKQMAKEEEVRFSSFFFFSLSRKKKFLVNCALNLLEMLVVDRRLSFKTCLECFHLPRFNLCANTYFIPFFFFFYCKNVCSISVCRRELHEKRYWRKRKQRRRSRWRKCVQ
jgi:hypothetical protein